MKTFNQFLAEAENYISVFDIERGFKKHIEPYLDGASTDADYMKRLKKIAMYAGVDIDTVDSYSTGDQIHYNMRMDPQAREYAQYIMDIQSGDAPIPR